MQEDQQGGEDQVHRLHQALDQGALGRQEEEVQLGKGHERPPQQKRQPEGPGAEELKEDRGELKPVVANEHSPVAVDFGLNFPTVVLT